MLVISTENISNTTVTKWILLGTVSSPIWYIVVCFIISFLCILGNGCVIYLIKTRSRLQDISNAFILSLAVSDLLVGVIVFPSRLACEMLPADILLQKVFSELFMYWSVYNLCGMTIERFVYIVLPMKHQFYMTRKRCIFLIFLCWFIPLTNFVLHFTWLYSEHETKKFWLKNFTAIETITMVGIPAVILVVLYSTIFTVAQRHRKITSNQIGNVSYNKNSSLELAGSDTTGPSICVRYNQGLSSDEEGLRLESDTQGSENCAHKMDIRDKTSASSSNTEKCRVNEKPTSHEIELRNLPITITTECPNSLNTFPKKRQDFEINPESDKPSTMVKAHCQGNCSRVENIDKVGQIGGFMRQNDIIENKTSDTRVTLNGQSSFNSILNDSIQNQLIGPKEARTELKYPIIEADVRKSPVAETHVRKSPIIEAHARESPILEAYPRKSPITEAQNISSISGPEETTTYLEFYNKIQNTSTKDRTKRSIKKRLTNLIQKKRRSGASVIGLVIAVFLICWGVSLYGSICYYFELCHFFMEISYVSWILLLFNSAVNPFVYAMLKTDLRKELANLVRCRGW